MSNIDYPNNNSANNTSKPMAPTKMYDDPSKNQRG